jgi:hypothetical protein
MVAGLLALGASAAETASGSDRSGVRHWAFQTLNRPAVPEVRRAERVRGPIDGFVQARLEGLRLSLGPEADRWALIRRVAFVLTGLPPTPEEIETFLADDDREGMAYARMVERYLASPRFGEAWGKRWLDAAGYADSNGYFNADTDRPLASRYRDYVVRAFNRNLPFDRFVREQLAGDELSGWRPGEPVTPEIVELLEATHFLRNGQDGSGESDGNPDEVRADRYYALESALQIVGSCLMGTTLQCAKCHDHKFEPVTQQEYYRLQALLYPAFNIEKWAKPNDRVVEAPLPGELESWQARERGLDAEESEARRSLASWMTSERPRGRVLFTDRFEPGVKLTERWSNVAPGDDHPGGSPAVTLDSAQAPGAVVDGGRLQIVEGGGSGDRWISTRQSFEWRPGRTGEWIQVTFDLVAVKVKETDRPAERVGYFLATHDFDDSSGVAGGNVLIDGHPDGPTQVQTDYPGTDARGRGEIGSSGYRAGRNYGVRLTRTGADEFLLEHLVEGAPEGKTLKLAAADLPPGGFGFEYCCGRSFVVDNVEVESSNDADADWVRRDAVFREALSARKKEVDDRLQSVAARRTPKPGRIAWVSDRESEPPEVRLLKRGNPKTPGPAVEPGFPAYLATGGTNAVIRPSATGTGRRRAWAEWMTACGSPQSALLARVTVNRFWQACFGAGLVSTPDNLGVSGSRPSHPELLEWLAAKFVESGWDTKALLRRVVQSSVFRQASVATPEALERDASNQALSRFPLRRLEAEQIRDAVLSVSGRLGGKSEGPYVPTMRDGSGEVVVDEGRADAFSRSLFLQQRRTQVTTLLGLFDAPAIVFNCTQRSATTQPLQSLGLLNSGFAVRRGEDLAERLRRECGGEVGARIRRGFLLVAGRGPEAEEETWARAFLDEQRGAYAGRADAELRAWADFGQALLAMNSFLYLE